MQLDILIACNDEFLHSSPDDISLPTDQYLNFYGLVAQTGVLAPFTPMLCTPG
jgi:hypothetical protein